MVSSSQTTRVAQQNKVYTTKEICDLFDISKATLFRWETEGLISEVGRDWRNWRLYSDRTLKEIRQIINGQGRRNRG